MRNGIPASTAAYRAARMSELRREHGFALVTVVWGMGLVALLATMVIVGSRHRVHQSADALTAERLSLGSEAAVNLALARVTSADAAFWQDPRIACRLPGGLSIVAFVAREAGKVDLNAADEDLLRRLFAALAGPDAGSKVAANIVAFRKKAEHRDQGLADAYVADGRPEGPKGGPFISTRELDQVLGVTPTLLRRAMRFVTVKSARRVPDYAAASPELLDLLGIDRARPAATTVAGEQAVDATIRTVVSDGHGDRQITDVLVSTGPPGRTLAVREWSRGSDEEGLQNDDQRERAPTGRTSCLP